MNFDNDNVGRPKKRTCFVISPIGDEGSEERDHADAVYELIINPAMEKCGVDAHRSDQVTHPGRITDQMFTSLLQSDFCIAVVSFNNPNVFYELAIAHAASRPVIILNVKGNKLPFNIKDMRCVEYQYDPLRMHRGEYARMVEDHIHTLDDNGWQAPDFLGDYGLPVGEKFKGITTFHAESNEFNIYDGWEKAFQQIRSRFDIAGVNLSQWCNIRDFKRRLIALCAGGCRARILILDHNHPVLKCCFNPAIPETIPDQVVKNIETMLKFYRDIEAESKNVEIRTIRNAIFSSELTITDDLALSRLCLYSQQPDRSPLWGCRRGSHLYNTLAQEFDSLWAASAP